MEKCCICGKEFNGYGNSAEPIKYGVCCDQCNLRFVLTSRILVADCNGSVNFEVVKNDEQMSRLTEKLCTNDFERVSKFESEDVQLYVNPMSRQMLVVCVV